MKFLFSLSLASGYASPSRMLREIRPSELGLWAALWQVDPWGEQRADLRAGIVASTVVNWAGKAKARGARDAKPSDFMPFVRREGEAAQDDLSKRLRSALTAAGHVGKAKDKEKGKR